ncbi:MAG: hypothetical protein NT007_09445 [Candidatus Kapabacteria bacterium]|nr:hypothetical protein [Candidatus Kapabacteria bacterium]
MKKYCCYILLIIVYYSLICDNNLIYADSLNLNPLTELGVIKYKNFEGGLFPNGMNIVPDNHLLIGQSVLQNIQPRDNSGNLDMTNGKIVFLSVGMSNTTQEFSTFKQLADTLKNKNPKLIIVDGAQGGQTAAIIQNPSATFWEIINQRLSTVKLSPQQVQVVWLKEADISPQNNFPIHAQTLTNELKKVCQVIKSKYPNTMMCFVSSRIYGGYASSSLNPEPMAYESGFSVKWLVDAQINQDTALICTGSNPKVPWISWGPYLWANGLKARNDGLTWAVSDFVTSDGTHPSTSGRLKVANLLVDFFTSNNLTIPWFQKSPTEVEDWYNSEIKIFPNPASDAIYINSSYKYYEIYNSFGQKVHSGIADSKIDITCFDRGVYFIRTGAVVRGFIKE